ncbi:MAG: methyltransferase domain-containing protein [Flavicella sp.]
MNAEKILYFQHTFYCAGVSDFDKSKLGTFDVVVATGVLHHLHDKEVVELLQFAKSVLGKNGRLVTFDGCYHDLFQLNHIHYQQATNYGFKFLVY